jgi:hypothetical protein
VSKPGCNLDFVGRGFAGGVLLGLSRSAALKELVEMVRPPSDFCLQSRS